MALGDFLTEGAAIPAGSAVTSVTKQTVLPAWYTNYATDLLSGQQALSDRPYDTYQGPRVAGFTPTQQQGFGMTQQAATGYQPTLNSAIGAASSAANGPGGLAAAHPFYSSAVSLNPSNTAQPYYNAATSMDPSAAAAGDYGTARGLVGAAAGMKGSTVAQPWLTAAGGINPMSAAQPGLANATNMASSAVNSGGGLAVAQPYLNKAGVGSVNPSAYMNPYTDAVVKRIGDLGVRNLNENIMPGIEGRYIGAGQLGYGGRGGTSTPSGMLTDTARAIRDTNDDILGKQSEALQAGYTQAQGAMQTDNAQQGQLAATAGGLGTAQQNAGLTAAGLNANVGQTAGGLAQAYQDALTRAGATAGNLATADAGTNLAAANASANLGTNAAGLTQQQQQLLASIGTNAGGLTQQQQQLLASMGTNSGNLATADAGTGLAAANQLGGLAQQQQQLGLTGANAVTATGTAQQGLNQQNLDVAYQDFLRQQGYPQDQIDKMLGTFKGVATGVPSGSTEAGIVPSGQQAQYQPSTASNIASGLAGVAGILSAIGKI